eukprot:TRINITY_DN9120_c0_g1_i1.p4 TRINITY_DN9120_c0_g1~~TRINITY_DN9120_c0_g1_i1.p4  ORF type:complete len:105 (-),score=5.12 TRINITY_DN9120_c0_g1_i1:12-326(-)
MANTSALTQLELKPLTTLFLFRLCATASQCLHLLPLQNILQMVFPGMTPRIASTTTPYLAVGSSMMTLSCEFSGSIRADMVGLLKKYPLHLRCAGCGAARLHLQ